MSLTRPNVPQAPFEPLAIPAIELMDECESDCVLKDAKNTKNRITFYFSRSTDNQSCLFKKTHNRDSNNAIYFELWNGSCSVFYSCEDGTCGQKELKKFEIDTRIIDVIGERGLLELDPKVLNVYIYIREMRDKYNSTFV